MGGWRKCGECGGGMEGGGWGEGGTHRRGQGWGVGTIRQRQGRFPLALPAPLPLPLYLPLPLPPSDSGSLDGPPPTPSRTHLLQSPAGARRSPDFVAVVATVRPSASRRGVPHAARHAGPCARGCHPACCWRALRHPNDQCRSDRPTSLAAGAPTMISLPSSIAIAACAVACHGMLIVTCVLI